MLLVIIISFKLSEYIMVNDVKEWVIETNGDWNRDDWKRSSEAEYRTQRGEAELTPYFKFCPIWTVQKVFWGHFLPSGRKSDLKTWITQPKLSVSNFAFFTLWPWTTLTWHKVTKVLGGYLRVSQTWSMSFHWLCFNLISLLCPAKLVKANNKKYDLSSNLWRHKWHSGKILQHIRKVKP